MRRFAFCMALLLALLPLMADAGCGDGTCAVGAIGTGGDASGGQAQGLHFAEQFPGGSLTNSGNASAGRLDVNPFGSITGTFRNDTARGHGTDGFGDWSGHCEDPFSDPDGC